MGPMRLLRLGIFVAGAALSAACTVESTYGESAPVENVDPNVPVLAFNDAGVGDAARVSGGSSDPSSTSMLALVDPNVKMNASPGQGVGVFAEYDSGGHWSLWWTCDTSITGQSCPFDVQVSVATGSIVDPAPDHFTSSDVLITPSTPGSGKAGGIEAKTLTTTGTQGVVFDTDPGATITLTATVSGLYNGRFLFWVQGGQINGGYSGTVTDPLMLMGASP
jgi:hypothetical protein